MAPAPLREHLGLQLPPTLRLFRRGIAASGRLIKATVKRYPGPTIALVILLSLYFLPTAQYGVREKDTVVDLLASLRNPTTDLAKFIEVQIDDRTFEYWGDPPTLSRNEVATVIDSLVKQKPAVIVLELDFPRKQEPASAPPGRLSAVLASINASPDAPIVVLMLRSKPYTFDNTVPSSTDRDNGSTCLIELPYERTEQTMWTVPNGINNRGEIIGYWRGRATGDDGFIRKTDGSRRIFAGISDMSMYAACFASL